MKRKLLLLFSLIIVALLIVNINPMTIDEYSGAKGKSVWAHRGSHKDFKENSMNAIDDAFQRGAAGVELDVFFRNGTFVVCHNRPCSGLTLYDVFTKYPFKRFWIDFKSAQKIDIDSALARLEYLTTQFSNKDLIVIESRRWFELGKIAQAGFYTTWWVRFNNDFFSHFRAFYSRFIIRYYGFSSLSFDHRHYRSWFSTFFYDVPQLCFTVDNRKRAKKLLSISQIRLVLTDNQALYLLAK